MQYHPDKNKDELISVAGTTYAEIYEAYKILSNASAKKQYDIDLFIFKSTSPLIKTNASEILIDIVKLYFNTINQNEYFKNHNKLTFELKQLLNANNINVLNNNTLNCESHKFFNYLLKLLRTLNFNRINEVLIHANTLHIPTKYQLILSKYMQAKKWEHKWIISRPYVGLLFAILICLLIFFLSKKV
jgi:hypothetical protein